MKAFMKESMLGILVIHLCVPWSGLEAAADPGISKASPVTLRDCIENALARNRAVQIERLNPAIARLNLGGAYGYYDPVFTSQVRRDRDNDTGGFDPADFSRDAVYSAQSEVASGGLTGFLPSGLNYSLFGTYAHSDGTRNSLDFDSYKLMAGASIRQPLLRDFWTDQGRTEIRLNKKLLTMSELGLRYVILDTVNQVHQAYYELQFSIENLGVRQRLLAAKQATLEGVQRQVQVGTLTVLEERLAMSQVARVEAELVAVSNTVQQAENILRTVLGHSLEHWEGGALLPVGRLLVIPEPLQLAASWQRGLEQRPDLGQMKADCERAGIDLRFRHNQLFPYVDVIAGYGRRGANAVQTIPPLPAQASLTSAYDQLDDGVAPNHYVGITFTTPLSRARERNAYRAGKDLAEQAQLRFKQKQEWVLREVSDALHNTESARRRVSATQRAQAHTRAALEAEEQKLAGGTSSLFFVFQLQGDLADVESAEVRARADYNKFLAQLRFAEGTLLQHAGIVIRED